MNTMLRNYYAKINSNPRKSLCLSVKPKKSEKKRTKSQSTFNNLTKTSEKSIKVKKKSIENQRLRKSRFSVPHKNAHKYNSSYIPLEFVNKTKGVGMKNKKVVKHKSKYDAEITLSESYDSLLNGFQCSNELRESLKRLVRLEKSALKKKFSSKSSFYSNSVFVNNYHNSRL